MVINGVRLSVQDEKRLKNSAKVAQALENKWDRRVIDSINRSVKADAESISAGANINPPDFEEILIQHYFDVKIAAIRIAESEQEKGKRLAKGPTLADIRRKYDLWRKGLWKPRRVAKYAKDLKAQYIDAVQGAWKRYSEDFRHGVVAVQEDVKRKIKAAVKTTSARAQTIVRTETTRYYNQTRRDYYDQGSDVTHYLFIAVRDKATTVYCTSLTVNGKRGRSGLVYAKTDPLLDKETPPVHWNCRSELLPLNRFNPTHRKMIENGSIQRRNCVCHSLPVGWSK